MIVNNGLAVWNMVIGAGATAWEPAPRKLRFENCTFTQDTNRVVQGGTASNADTSEEAHTTIEEDDRRRQSATVVKFTTAVDEMLASQQHVEARGNVLLDTEAVEFCDGGGFCLGVGGGMASKVVLPMGATGAWVLSATDKREQLTPSRGAGGVAGEAVAGVNAGTGTGTSVSVGSSLRPMAIPIPGTMLTLLQPQPGEHLGVKPRGSTFNVALLISVDRQARVAMNGHEALSADDIELITPSTEVDPTSPDLNAAHGHYLQLHSEEAEERRTVVLGAHLNDPVQFQLGCTHYAAGNDPGVGSGLRLMVLRLSSRLLDLTNTIRVSLDDSAATTTPDNSPRGCHSGNSTRTDPSSLLSWFTADVSLTPPANNDGADGIHDHQRKESPPFLTENARRMLRRIERSAAHGDQRHRSTHATITISSAPPSSTDRRQQHVRVWAYNAATTKITERATAEAVMKVVGHTSLKCDRKSVVLQFGDATDGTGSNGLEIAVDLHRGGGRSGTTRVVKEALLLSLCGDAGRIHYASTLEALRRLAPVYVFLFFSVKCSIRY